MGGQRKAVPTAKANQGLQLSRLAQVSVFSLGDFGLGSLPSQTWGLSV